MHVKVALLYSFQYMCCKGRLRENSVSFIRRIYLSALILKHCERVSRPVMCFLVSWQFYYNVI